MPFGKRLLILFLTGFILGPIGDYTHVVTETTGYPQDKFVFYVLGLPFWVPFLFGSAAVLMGLAATWLDRIMPPRKQRLGVTNGPMAVIGLLLFLGVYALSGILPFRTGGITDVILAALAVLIWLALDGTWQGVLLGVVAAILGTLNEIQLIKFGAFYYWPRAANFYGVPTWLPWLYFAASVSVGNWARYLASFPAKTSPVPRA